MDFLADIFDHIQLLFHAALALPISKNFIYEFFANPVLILLQRCDSYDMSNNIIFIQFI